jgi:hypothetical protein
MSDTRTITREQLAAAIRPSAAQPRDGLDLILDRIWSLLPQPAPAAHGEPRTALSCLDGAWPCQDRFHKGHVLKAGVYGDPTSTPEEYGADEWEPFEAEAAQHAPGLDAHDDCEREQERLGRLLDDCEREYAHLRGGDRE